MIADDVDHRLPRLLGVMDVGDGIAEAWTQMQQCGCWLFGHARVAICCTRRDAFEQAQHAAHAIDPIERRHEMHFRRAGVGEGDIDAAADHRPHEAFSAIHGFLASVFYRHCATAFPIPTSSFWRLSPRRTPRESGKRRRAGVRLQSGFQQALDTARKKPVADDAP